MAQLNLSKEESLKMLDLRKQEVQKLCLEKRELSDLVSRVAVVLDFSGSMDRLYKNGTVQSVLERLFPIALQFDDNGEMEVWIFSDGFNRVGNISMDNYYGYVTERIYNRYRMGGTNYAPVLADIRKKYINEEPAKLPNYVIFITDGENMDESNARRVITEMSKEPIFIQFVGIGNESFRFLKELDDLKGRYVDNANFFKIKDINSESDSDLYQKLLAEYPSWLALPEVKNMIENQSLTPKAEKKGLFSKFFS